MRKRQFDTADDQPPRPSESPSMSSLNRRSFLGRASLSAMGIAFAPIDWGLRGSTTWAQEGTLPEDLGRGFLSTGEAIRPLIADLNSSSPVWRPDFEHDWDIVFAKSRSSYAKLVSGSARLKFGAGPFSGDARASSSKEFRSERHTVHLVAWKKAQTGHHTLDSPVLRSDVALESSPWAFVKRFGDRLIDRVTLGGELMLVYTLAFEREAQASKFTAGGTARYKGASAAAAFHSAIRSDSAGARVSLRGFCRGVKTVPSLIASSGVGRADDPGVTELLRFWDNFDEMVQEDDVAAPIALRSISVQDVGGGPALLDVAALRAFNRTIDAVVALDDEIDGRLASLSYLKTKCLPWNTHVDPQDIRRREQMLQRFARTLNEWVEPRMLLENVTSFDDRLVPPFNEDALPTIPENWLCRDLEKVAGWELTYRGANTGVNVPRALPPRLIPGQHIEVRGKVTKYGKAPGGSSGPYVNGALKFNTGAVIQAWNPMENAGVDVNAIVRVPAGASSVVLTGIAYGSGPLVVNLSLLA